MAETWTIQRTLDYACGYLEHRGSESARVDAQWLLSKATGLSRIELYMDYQKPLKPEELEVIREGLKRRAIGEPLQYICNSAPFRYLDLFVDSRVLIPRPETEVLVDYALKAINGISGTKNVADVCCGSGCIACSLAKEVKGADNEITITASDISFDALEVARINADTYNLTDSITFLQSDLMDSFSEFGPEIFDVIVSNPPYIPNEIIKELDNQVKEYEPLMALAGGIDGLDFYRKLLKQTIHYLKPRGYFLCELHETCLEEAAQQAMLAGFHDIIIYEDLNHKPRVLSMRK